MTEILEAGRCRVCGCTDLNPCLSQGGDGRALEACSWMDADRTLCSNLRCIAVSPIDELIKLRGIFA
ncbi:MAG: hypothetical protein ACRD59_10710 [Candidatus Acidiferrales bacterium]